MFQCQDVLCADHKAQLCQLYANIIQACLDASYCIHVVTPSDGGAATGGQKRIPGWSEHVEQFKQESLLWHRQWKAQGSPHDGAYSDMRIITRAHYKGAVRYVMNNSDDLKMTKMAEAIVDRRDRNL